MALTGSAGGAGKGPAGVTWHVSPDRRMISENCCVRGPSPVTIVTDDPLVRSRVGWDATGQISKENRGLNDSRRASDWSHDVHRE